MDILFRAVRNVLTLYMVLILLRWVAPWLQVDLFNRRLYWVCRLTDPLINLMRRLLPPMGPVDFGPVAALFVVWVARIFSESILIRLTPGI